MRGLTMAGLALIGLAALLWLSSWLLERREPESEDEEAWWWDQFGD